MGDGADDARYRGEIESELWLKHVSGELTPEESMGLGFIDEFGNEDPEYVVTNRGCRPSGPGPCPVCGEPTRLRDGQFGKFYGCELYPACKGSRDYE